MEKEASGNWLGQLTQRLSQGWRVWWEREEVEAEQELRQPVNSHLIDPEQIPPPRQMLWHAGGWAYR